MDFRHSGTHQGIIIIVLFHILIFDPSCNSCMHDNYCIVTVKCRTLHDRFRTQLIDYSYMHALLLIWPHLSKMYMEWDCEPFYFNSYLWSCNFMGHAWIVVTVSHNCHKFLDPVVCVYNIVYHLQAALYSLVHTTWYSAAAAACWGFSSTYIQVLLTVYETAWTSLPLSSYTHAHTQSTHIIVMHQDGYTVLVHAWLKLMKAFMHVATQR